MTNFLISILYFHLFSLNASLQAHVWSLMFVSTPLTSHSNSEYVWSTKVISQLNRRSPCLDFITIYSSEGFLIFVVNQLNQRSLCSETSQFNSTEVKVPLTCHNSIQLSFRIIVMIQFNWSSHCYDTYCNSTEVKVPTI